MIFIKNILHLLMCHFFAYCIIITFLASVLNLYGLSYKKSLDFEQSERVIFSL